MGGGGAKTVVIRNRIFSKSELAEFFVWPNKRRKN